MFESGDMGEINAGAIELELGWKQLKARVMEPELVSPGFPKKTPDTSTPWPPHRSISMPVTPRGPALAGHSAT